MEEEIRRQQKLLMDISSMNGRIRFLEEENKKLEEIQKCNGDYVGNMVDIIEMLSHQFSHAYDNYKETQDYH